jgi:hypothetical protein
MLTVGCVSVPALRLAEGEDEDEDGEEEGGGEVDEDGDEEEEGRVSEADWLTLITPPSPAPTLLLVETVVVSDWCLTLAANAVEEEGDEVEGEEGSALHFLSTISVLSKSAAPAEAAATAVVAAAVVVVAALS